MSTIDPRPLDFWKAATLDGPPFVHPQDRPFLNELRIAPGYTDFAAFATSADFQPPKPNELHLSLLPVPFVGNLATAEIVILLPNPGLELGDYGTELRCEEFRTAIRDTIRQDLEDRQFKFVYLDPQFSWHPGFRWWESRLRPITKEVAKRARLSYAGALRLLASKLACIERVPYHSAGLTLDAKLRALPSVRNALSLVREMAERRDVTWIVTRQLDAWSEHALSSARGRVLSESARRRSVSFSLESAWGQAILERVGLSKKAPEHVHRILQPGLDRLIRVLQPEAIYLFGSQARGDARPDSDFDIMVVLPDDAAKARVSVVKARAALGDVGHPIDVLVIRRRQFDEHLHLRASLPAVIADEGRVLYAA